MFCKLPTLSQVRKSNKFFGNKGLSLPPLATDSYRGQYSKVLQCAGEARSNLLQFGWGVHFKKKLDVKTDFPFFNLGSTSSSIGNGGQVQPLRVCVGCAGPILDQYILRVAPNLEWHAACLKCCQCQKFLDEKCTCFVRDGKIYCKEDYVRYSSSKP